MTADAAAGTASHHSRCWSAIARTTIDALAATPRHVIGTSKNFISAYQMPQKRASGTIQVTTRVKALPEVHGLRATAVVDDRALPAEVLPRPACPRLAADAAIPTPDALSPFCAAGIFAMTSSRSRNFSSGVVAPFPKSASRYSLYGLWKATTASRCAWSRRGDTSFRTLSILAASADGAASRWLGYVRRSTSDAEEADKMPEDKQLDGSGIEQRGLATDLAQAAVGGASAGDRGSRGEPADRRAPEAEGRAAAAGAEEGVAPRAAVRRSTGAIRRTGN